MRDLFLGPLLLAILVQTFRAPSAGVLGWTWLTLMTPQKLIWGTLSGLPLNLILAQRLCRKLCNSCKKPVKDFEPQALLDAGVPADKVGQFTLYDKNGCRDCNDRGYRGRVAVYEVMPFWDGLKELVINGASAAELKQEAIRLGMQTLRMSAINKVIAGVSTLEEAVGNTAPDRF